jgi:SAM-dependent methyltransferase
VWTYHGPSPIRSAFNRKHDTILAYVKSEKYTFNADAVRQPYNPATVRTFKASSKAGFGKVPDLDRGKVPEDWWYFPVVARLHRERTGYPTQKPEALLKRIILASSNPGDLVADLFCGSGTAAVAAARLGRNFIAVDSSFRALHTTRRRLCELAAGPFTIERDAASEVPRAGTPEPTAERAADTFRVDANADLDYWEVDPRWDGGCFRSAAQACRPNGSGEIRRELRVKTGRNACVRLVTVDGGQTQQELDV